MLQVFHVELVVKATELMFSPPLSELEAVVNRLVTTIVEAAQGLPRVWTMLDDFRTPYHFMCR